MKSYKLIIIGLVCLVAIITALSYPESVFARRVRDEKCDFGEKIAEFAKDIWKPYIEAVNERGQLEYLDNLKGMLLEWGRIYGIKKETREFINSVESIAKLKSEGFNIGNNMLIAYNFSMGLNPFSNRVKEIFSQEGLIFFCNTTWNQARLRLG